MCVFKALFVPLLNPAHEFTAPPPQVDSPQALSVVWSQSSLGSNIQRLAIGIRVSSHPAKSPVISPGSFQVLWLFAANPAVILFLLLLIIVRVVGSYDPCAWVDQILLVTFVTLAIFLFSMFQLIATVWVHPCCSHQCCFCSYKLAFFNKNL